MASLPGMKAITEYVKRSEVTVLKLMRTEDFPAKKLGGIWESDTDLLARQRNIPIVFMI